MTRKCPNFLITWEINILKSFEIRKLGHFRTNSASKMPLLFHFEAYASTWIISLSQTFCPNFWKHPPYPTWRFIRNLRGMTLSNDYIDVGDGYWWQLYDVGKGFGHFGHRHPLSFYICVGYQHLKIVTNVKSSTSRCHQHHCHPF